MLKRTLDVTVATVLLLVLSPVLLGVLLAVRIGLGSPVLFRHDRPGRGGRTFRMLKLRTMTDARDASGQLLDDGARLTRLGRVLRATSLDELPALINVVRGDMSLVGPRPLLVEYLPHYTVEEARRHEVRPGVTGWAQVNGRNDLAWDDKLALDVWYVTNRTMWLDLRILVRTLAVPFRREGISRAGHATAPRLDVERRRSAPPAGEGPTAS